MRPDHAAILAALSDLRQRLRRIDDEIEELDGALDRLSDALGIPAEEEH